MKYLLRVPTKEQYAYIEEEFEGDAEGAVSAYETLTRLVQGGVGISAKDFAKLIHEYCTSGEIVNGGDIHETLSPGQGVVLNELKKLIRKTK